MKKDAERRRCDTKNIRRETKLFINRFVSVCHLERVRVPLGGMRTSRKIPKVRPLPCRLEVFSPNCMCCLFPSAIHRAGWCEITPWPAPPECHPRGLPQFLLRQNRRIGRTAPHRRVSRSNAESTSSMIKRKFGDYLRSRSDVAMVNESLCKVTRSEERRVGKEC